MRPMRQRIILLTLVAVSVSCRGRNELVSENEVQESNKQEAKAVDNESELSMVDVEDIEKVVIIEDEIEGALELAGGSSLSFLDKIISVKKKRPAMQVQGVDKSVFVPHKLQDVAVEPESIKPIPSSQTAIKRERKPVGGLEVHKLNDETPIFVQRFVEREGSNRTLVGLQDVTPLDEAPLILVLNPQVVIARTLKKKQIAEINEGSSVVMEVPSLKSPDGTVSLQLWSPKNMSNSVLFSQNLKAKFNKIKGNPLEEKSFGFFAKGESDESIFKDLVGGIPQGFDRAIVKSSSSLESEMKVFEVTWMNSKTNTSRLEKWEIKNPTQLRNSDHQWYDRRSLHRSSEGA